MDNVTEIIQQINAIVEELLEKDERLGVLVADFIANKMIDQDDDSTYELALQYAQWARAKPDLALDENRITWNHSCYKGVMWHLVRSDDDEEVTVRPCDHCRPDQYRFWESGFIEDSDQLPH